MDTESFSTPPSTPVVHSPFLQIDLGLSYWNPDIELYATSPSKSNGIQTAPSMEHHPAAVQVPPLVTPSSNHKSDNSPCFVHSHLDKGTLLADWLRNKHHPVGSSDVGVAKSLTSPNRTTQISPFAPGYETNNDDDEFVGSLTKQLAETAVGVREMSKQLGPFLSHFSMILQILIIP